MDTVEGLQEVREVLHIHLGGLQEVGVDGLLETGQISKETEEVRVKSHYRW